MVAYPPPPRDDDEPSDGETLGSEDTSDEEYEEDESSNMSDFIVDDDESLEYETDSEGDDSEDADADAGDVRMKDAGAAIIMLPWPAALGRSYAAIKANVAGADAEDDDETARGTKRRRDAFTREERSYLSQLPDAERQRMEALADDVAVANQSDAVPLRFRILASPMSPAAKSHLIARLNNLARMNEGSGEYHKINNWMHSAVRLPLGVYEPLSITGTPAEVRAFLQRTRATLDAAIYGHKDSKDQILRILAQWVSNPASRGHCIGIQGPMGTGKTSLVKNGIAKALNAPFAFIALGGASDGAFLEGHGFTYEGSTYGKIAEALMKAQCMNPILFFDELDKVSETSRGEEIIHILTHLTDASQNERITDRYFSELDLDLSKALMVFSYNDESRVNPILRDRMITIRVEGYTTEDKLVIAADHLLPSIYEQYGLAAGDVVFAPDVLRAIIGRVGDERGVRNLRRGLESIVGWLNMLRYVPEDPAAPVVFPVRVDEAMVRKYLKKEGGGMSEEVARAMYM